MNRNEVNAILSQEENFDVKPSQRKKNDQKDLKNNPFLDSVLDSIEKNPREWVVTIRLTNRAREKMNNIRMAYLQKGVEFKASKVIAEIVEVALADK